MNESSTKNNRIARLISLAASYFDMEDGEPIDFYEELLEVFEIHSPTLRIHPLESYRVYISRRALKHFVERRKKDMLVRHSEREALQAIHLALERIEITITDFDLYEVRPKNDYPHSFLRRYPSNGARVLCVLLSKSSHSGNSLEVCSIHFRARGNK